MNIINGIVNLFRFDKTNWRAFALCLVAATVFWFFNALNKEHTATISFPVEFQYNQSAFIPVRALPQHVLINITGSGWDLLRRSIGFKVEPLLILLDRPVETRKLPPGSLLALASAQMDKIKINHVATDTLQIFMDRKKTKRVKLFVDVARIQFQQNFGLSSEVTFGPDSITLVGPFSVLNQIPDSVQIELPNDPVEENVSMDGLIILPVQDAVTMDKEKAHVEFKVSNLVEQSKKIKIVVFPAPPFRYQLSTDSILVKFRVPFSLMDSLASNDGLFAVIDLRECDAGTTKTLPSIKGTIPFTSVVSIDSITLRKY